MAAGATVSWQTIVAESKISLNSADTAMFIRLYRDEELLWNVNLTDHTNKHKRVESLQRISKKMGKNWSTEQVRDKIMSLRSRYSKEIVKVRVSIASGADPCYQPVWQYFPMLDCFLRPFSVTRKTDTPVVRAFHKRLMEGGVSANQPSTPAMAYPTPPHDVSATTTPHFFHSPQLADPLTASPYQRSQQNILPPPAELDYMDNDDDDDDDDVQIVEEDVSKVMEEVAMLIENQGEDDRDSGYNGGFREGGFGIDGAVESYASGRTCSREEGSWINSPFVGSDLAHAEGASGEEGSLLSETAEEFSSQPDHHHSDSLHDSGAGPGVTQAGRQQAQSPLNQERQLQNTVHVVAVEGPDQNSSRLPHPKESSESDGVVIKLERPAALQSPPPPPLPRRRSLTDSKDSPAVVNNEGSRAGILQGHRASFHDSSVRDSGQRAKRRQSFTGEGHRRGSEAFLKRIKREKDSDMSVECTYGEVSTPDLQPDTEQPELTSSPGFNPASRGQAGVDLVSPRNTFERRSNPAHQNPREFSSQTSSSSHRNAPRMTANFSASIVSPSCDSAVNRVRDAASPATSDRSSAVSIVSQVTDGVSRQMTSLLQTLVTNLADSASGGVSADANMAFAGYIKAELTKLDEDLQADVKFSIQKVIYEAQKEMSRRRTSIENNVE